MEPTLALWRSLERLPSGHPWVGVWRKAAALQEVTLLHRPREIFSLSSWGRGKAAALSRSLSADESAKFLLLRFFCWVILLWPAFPRCLLWPAHDPRPEAKPLTCWVVWAPSGWVWALLCHDPCRCHWIVALSWIRAGALKGSLAPVAVGTAVSPWWRCQSYQARILTIQRKRRPEQNEAAKSGVLALQDAARWGGLNGSR